MTTHITHRRFNNIVETLLSRGYDVKIENKSDAVLGNSTTAEVSASNGRTHIYLSVTISAPSGISSRKRTSIRTYGGLTHFGNGPKDIQRKRVNLETAIYWLDAVSRNVA